MANNILEHWKTQGYVIMRGIFERDRTANLRRICEESLQRWRASEAGIAAGPDATYFGFPHKPEFYADRPQQDLTTVLDAVADPRSLSFIQTLLGGEPPLFFMLACFANPQANSTDGHWHRDTQFSFKPDAEKEYLLSNDPFFGLQFQIALVESEDLEYVPGSHLRWDTEEEFAIRLANDKANNRSNSMPGALRFRLEPGDGVAFAPNGLHRGRYHVDKLRRTFMPTYSRASKRSDCNFTNQPWFLQPNYLDGVKPDTRRFFEEFIAAYKHSWVDTPKVEATMAKAS